MEKYDDDYMELVKMLKGYHVLIEKLEADALKERSETMAVFLCLRDFTKADPNKLLETFKHYSKEIHQKMLERVEDIDSWIATRLDKRDDTEAP